MFEGAFSFSGRVGRLSFFLSSLVAWPAAMITCLFVTLLPMSWHAKVFFVALVAIALIWFFLSLHVRRIRDIGWDPFIVIVGAVALASCDVVLAHIAPALSKNGYSTPIGSIISGGLTLALLFWPGQEAPSIQDRSYRFTH